MGHMVFGQLFVTLLLFGGQGGGARNWPKTCVVSEWLTLLCAIWIALTEWDGQVLYKHMLWRHRKCWKFKAKFIIQSQQKYLIVSLKEHENYRVTCSSVSVNFMLITTISQSPCSTRANKHHLFKAAAAKQVLRSDWYASAISKLTFSNTNLKVFFLWCMPYQLGTYEMKQESTQNLIEMGSSICPQIAKLMGPT